MTAKEMASGLYFTIQEISKKSINSDGQPLLNKYERSLLLLSHAYSLLKTNNLGKVISKLQSVFVQEQRNITENEDRKINMTSLQNSVKEIQTFFEEMPAESHKFFKKDFLFDKDLDPHQKTLVLAWYREYSKVIDKTLQDILKEFKLTQ